MKNIILSIAFTSFLAMEGLNAQQPIVTQKELATSSFFYNASENIFTTGINDVFYLSSSEDGYYIEKYTKNLELVKSLLVTYTKDANILYSYPLIIKEKIYLIIASYNKAEKLSEIKAQSISSTSLKLEAPISLLKVQGKISDLGMETQSRLVVSQSELKNYLALTVFVGKDFTENAEFIVGVFDINLKEVWNQRFKTNYVDYAFLRPQVVVDNNANVFIESRMAFDHIQKTGEEFHHIVCLTKGGTTMKIIDFKDNADQFIYNLALAPLVNDQLFVYAITSDGIKTYLIDAIPGHILMEEKLEIDMEVWKKSAFYMEGKFVPVGMYFMPILLQQDSKGNIYFVGEQNLNGQNYSVLLAKFNADMKMEWLKIIPKFQYTTGGNYIFHSIQAEIWNDSLNIFYNFYINEPADKSWFLNGNVNSEMEYGYIKSDNGESIKLYDMVKAYIPPDGNIQFQKIAENNFNFSGLIPGTLKPGSGFSVGSVSRINSDFYFITSQYCGAALSDFTKCTKSISRVQL